MQKLLLLRCSSCRAEYALPATHRQHIEGKAVLCAGCERWWVPIAASSGPRVKLVDGRPERAPIDLRPFRRAPADAAPTATTAPAAAPTAHGLDATARVPPSAAEGGPICLRVIVTAPGTALDRKAVFDLGSKSFLIGQKGCHLNLTKAAIPQKAIRIRPATTGFGFEGVAGFTIPVGSMSIASGQIEPGGSVSFELVPYLIQLETSTTPGRPIADLEPTGSPAKPAESPAKPAESPTEPAAPPPPATPPQPAPVQPVQPPQPQYLGQPAAVDLRQQVQEIAVDVRGDQLEFSEQQDAMQEALDGDQTITDLGAKGFHAASFGNPLAGLNVSLVRGDGPTKGQSFRISKSPLVIGRKEGELIIRDRRVSSKHAQLDIAGPRIYTLKDLASTNGTSVNDRPISVGHLEDGDVVSFGGVKFEFVAKLTG